MYKMKMYLIVFFFFDSIDILYGDLMACIPFENTIDLVEIKGKYLKSFFEGSVKNVNSSSTFYAYGMIHVSGKNKNKDSSFIIIMLFINIFHSLMFVILLQFSLGIHIVYNTTNAPFNRITSMHILSRNATKPIYEPLDESKVYRIIMPSFTVKFGDPLIRDNMESHR